MYDLIIIGSGPAGLSAAVYGIRAGLKLIVIEKMFQGMGQITQSSQVDNYLGLPGMDGFSLGMKFRDHAQAMDIEFVESEVSSIMPDNDKWTVQSISGETFTAKSIIIATGATHRKLEIPGESTFEGRGVSYCATCDGAFYRGKVVAVNGGGDTALDDALYLAKICEKVYLIHRRDEFRAAASTITKVQNTKNIELILNSEIIEIDGEDIISSIKIRNKINQEESYLFINGLFIAIGSRPLSSIVPPSVELDSNGYIVADESCTTSAPGLFVAGDVRTKSLRQVITAVSDGAIAATAASEYISNLD